MFSSHKEMENDTESIRETMQNCRRQLKNRPMLRKLAMINPSIPSITRWSGICRTVKRFQRISGELVEYLILLYILDIRTE